MTYEWTQPKPKFKFGDNCYRIVEIPDRKTCRHCKSEYVKGKQYIVEHLGHVYWQQIEQHSTGFYIFYMLSNKGDRDRLGTIESDLMTKEEATKECKRLNKGGKK